jgi:hypothetical protein
MERGGQSCPPGESAGDMRGGRYCPPRFCLAPE